MSTFRGSVMGKSHSIELRERVVAFVDEGNSHRDAARHFRVLPKFVHDMVKLRRETGALLAKPQGNLGRTGKIFGYKLSGISIYVYRWEWARPGNFSSCDRS